MKIYFELQWVSKGKIQKAFKSKGGQELFLDYKARISRFHPCEASGKREEADAKRGPSKIWICHRETGELPLSSEKLAQKLKALLDSSVQDLYILIGGPDGFSAKDIQTLRPDLVWSFGPMTLPHELAAVVAGEQIYRALTILHGLPYHAGH